MFVAICCHLTALTLGALNCKLTVNYKGTDIFNQENIVNLNAYTLVTEANDILNKTRKRTSRTGERLKSLLSIGNARECLIINVGADAQSI